MFNFGMNPGMGLQASALGSAIGGRRKRKVNYINLDDYAPQSAANPQMQALGAGLGKGGALGNQQLPDFGAAGGDPFGGMGNPETSSIARRRMAGMMVGQANRPFKGMR